MDFIIIEARTIERRLAMASTTGWAELPADLLGAVIARLPFPGDRAAICAACRAWRAAARHHVRHQAPWIVLPDCSVCTTGRDGAFFDRIPGLPGENVSCLAAAGEGWLALDLTDDAFRRTPSWDMYCLATGTFSDARPDVKHAHSYMLHNPFSGETVPLPELDAVVGHVAETFEIRKVLMRSTTPDDVIAVTTNNCNYNIILCRPGKGTFVLPDFRIVDAAFVGDVLYGITTGEELLAFHLGEDSEDGKPNVTRIKRAIKNPMAAYYIKYSSWRWPQIVDDDSSDDDDGRGDYNNVDHEDYQEHSDGDEVEIQEDQAEFDDDPDIRFINGDDMVSDNEEKVYEDDWDPEVPYDAKDETCVARYHDDCSTQDENQNQDDNNDEEEDQHQDVEDYDDEFNGDGFVSDNEVREEDGVNREVPYDGTDETYTARYLVRSSMRGRDELLLVRHQNESPLHSNPYTSKVELFRADVSTGRWVPVTTTDGGLGEGEVLFLSRSFSKSTCAHGRDVEEGLVYYATNYLDDAFDTRSGTIRKMTFSWPWQRKLAYQSWLTWLFPPELVV
ncbi:unnamed protein product [Urochloa decumbens]|uniref:KIB1-4 beta-propeller domain-containing protein n=1 Tax=Urochloa decumbens TaxID=240449 RepID=A0ABC9C264_9POAL